MKSKINKLLIAKDDFPLEFIQGKPIINFIRKILLGSHYECRFCYENRKGIKVSTK